MVVCVDHGMFVINKMYDSTQSLSTLIFHLLGQRSLICWFTMLPTLTFIKTEKMYN